MRSQIQADKMSFLDLVAGLSLRDRLTDTQGELEVELLPVEVVQASDQEASWVPHARCFPGMSSWKAALC